MVQAPASNLPRSTARLPTYSSLPLITCSSNVSGYLDILVLHNLIVAAGDDLTHSRLQRVIYYREESTLAFHNNQMYRRTCTQMTITLALLLGLIAHLNFISQIPRLSLDQPSIRPNGKAPMHHCDLDIVPGSYMVLLSRGISLAAHMEAIGRGAELDAAMGRHHSSDMGQIYYSAHFSDSLLEAVRADSGVEKVECNQYVYAWGGIRGGH